VSLELLQRACEMHGQRGVAKKIGKSATTVNLVLKGKYPKPQPILKKVDEVFGWLKSDEVICPIVGELHIGVCQKYRTWSMEDRVHKDRLYQEVKEHCKVCALRGGSDEL